MRYLNCADSFSSAPQVISDEEFFNLIRDGVQLKEEIESKSQLVDGKMTWKVMQQVKKQQKEEGFDTAKDYEDNFPSLSADLETGENDFDENDDQYEDVDDGEEIIIDEDDDKTIQAFTGGGIRNTLTSLRYLFAELFIVNL